jgi:hypothetical protein
MNPDGSGILKSLIQFLLGFNSDSNYSWNTSGSQIIYPYFDKLYRINNDVIIQDFIKWKIHQNANGAMMVKKRKVNDPNLQSEIYD